MRSKLLKYILENQIIVALIFVATIWLMIEIKEVLIALFVSYILMAAIAPYSDFLESRRVPKPIAVIIPYVVALILIGVIILSLAPFLISQVQVLIERFPSYLNQEIKIFELKLDPGQLSSIASAEAENIGKGAFSVTSKVFDSIFTTVSVFAISFYLLLYKNTVREGFVSLFPKRSREKVKKTTLRVEEKLGSWLQGQVILSIVIGVLTWIALTILGIEFALPLAVIAAILELVPTIGPILALIPALIVALNISLPTSIAVVIAYILIQFAENHIVVPRVMQRAVGLNPIVIIVAIITGGKLLGIAGALLAIPFVSLLVVLYKSSK